MSQKEKIKAYLIKHKTITAWTAIMKFHALRLGAIIFELKHLEGLPIVGYWVIPSEKEFKKGKKPYYEYKLITNEEEMVEHNMNHIPRID